MKRIYLLVVTLTVLFSALSFHFIKAQEVSSYCTNRCLNDILCPPNICNNMSNQLTCTNWNNYNTDYEQRMRAIRACIDFRDQECNTCRNRRSTCENQCMLSGRRPSPTPIIIRPEIDSQRRQECRDECFTVSNFNGCRMLIGSGERQQCYNRVIRERRECVARCRNPQPPIENQAQNQSQSNITTQQAQIQSPLEIMPTAREFSQAPCPA